MAQYFYIKKGSVNPTLRMELVNDGKYDWFKNTSFNEAIQNADITFSMTNEHGILKISKQPCNIILSNNEGCDDRYIIEYVWKERDTKETGIFDGVFEINFNDDIRKPSTESDVYINGNVSYKNTEYPVGKFIMPIYEDLKIEIK